MQFEKLASPHWGVPGSTLRQGLTAVPEVKKLNPVGQKYHQENQHYNMFYEEALFLYRCLPLVLLNVNIAH